MKKVLFISIITLLFNFKTIKTNYDFEINNLYGNWVFKKGNLENQSFTKKVKLKKDIFGYSFKKDGNLIVRMSNTWCGTPPIILENILGKWKISESKILEIEYEVWYGLSKEKWKIDSLSKKHLNLVLIQKNIIKKENNTK